jgi:hypothetical protein
LLEAGASVPDTISKVLQDMIQELANLQAPSVSRLPGSYPASAIPESKSCVTASDTSWWTASGTEWVTAIEYTTSTSQVYETSTIASFMRNERSTSALPWRTALRNFTRFRAEQNALQAELIECIISGDLDLVIKLLDKGVSLESRKQFPPLGYAVANGNETIVKLLVEAGADVSVQLPGDFYDAMSYAVLGQGRRIVTLLAIAGVDVYSLRSCNQKVKELRYFIMLSFRKESIRRSSNIFSNPG